MNFDNFIDDQPDGNPYTHMDFDQGFAWNAKDDANDKDNGFVCKRPLQNWTFNYEWKYWLNEIINIIFI